MTLKRMDNAGIVVESLDDAIPFFVELGLKLEGRATISRRVGWARHRIGGPARRDRHASHPRRPQSA